MKKIKQIIINTMLAMLLSGVGITSFAQDYLIPGGETVGIKMYTEGLLVVGMSDVTDTSGRKIPLAKESGIKIGDILLSVNDTALSKNEDLMEFSNEETLKLTVKRKGVIKEITVNPVMTDDGPKIGLWLRDSTAGVGTVTYYTADKKGYAALGHGITDVDTGNILSLKSGNILNCTLSEVKKSKKGDIGELCCIFDGPKIGEMTLNKQSGIYGNLTTEISNCKTPLPVAQLNEVCEGAAKIMCSVTDEGTKEYDIKIKSISQTNDEGKTFVIEITDPELLKITGGIVQGMSGSPIIQDGKLIGAVTHVFVNDPTRGYGIYVGDMIDTTK